MVMVNACAPQGEPILGTGGEKKTGLCTFVLYAFYFTCGRRCRNLQRVQSSDGGISLPPALAPVCTVCTVADDSQLKTNVPTGFDMFKICTEAADGVAL